MFPSLQYIQAELDYRSERARRTYPTDRPRRRRFRLRRTHQPE